MLIKPFIVVLRGCTDSEQKENEEHESRPDECDAPDGETLDVLIRLVLHIFRLPTIITVLGGFEAAPGEVVQNSRHDLVGNRMEICWDLIREIMRSLRGIDECL